MKILWLLLAGVLVLIWLFFPTIFNWWALNIWDVSSAEVTKLGDLGSIGDIYGSLNTLFTSATLIIVLYSAYLQREANKDAREAMANQLQQARNSTAKQLMQARRALHLQLKQANELTAQQLALAQSTHDAQIAESKYAIFSNMFHELLNQKHERFNMIEVKKHPVYLNVTEILSLVNDTLYQLLSNEWSDISKVDVGEIHNKYVETMKKISCGEDDKGDNLSNLFLHFQSYYNLYELINRSELEIKDKVFFKNIVRDSMTLGEQVMMFWVAAFDSDTKSILSKNKVLSTFYDDKMMPFAVKFLDKDCFCETKILKNWDKYLKEQNPT